MDETNQDWFKEVEPWAQPMPVECVRSQLSRVRKIRRAVAAWWRMAPNKAGSLDEEDVNAD